MATIACLITLLVGCYKSDTELNNNDLNSETDAPSNSSTASKEVTVLSPDFHIKALNRDRTIRVYLPPQYESQSDKRYPVLYMHDAQNLFDAATSYAGEWNADETLNRLSKSHDLQLIIVGIDNGGEHRAKELSPWDNDAHGEGEGDEYLDFILNDVMPHVNQQYRTLTEAKHTAIMGSSMGGFLSHYAIHQHPEVFSKAGIFSPSYWYSKEVFAHTNLNPLSANHKMYFLMGSEEGADMLEGLEKMLQQLEDSSSAKASISSKVVSGQGHNEAFWGEEFGEAVLWLFSDH